MAKSVKESVQDEAKEDLSDTSAFLQAELAIKETANEQLTAELEAKTKEKAELEARLAELEAKMNTGGKVLNEGNDGGGNKEDDKDGKDLNGGSDGSDAGDGSGGGSDAGGNVPKAYPEVTNVQEAREILRRDYKASAQASGTRAAIESRMREFNIIFLYD